MNKPDRIRLERTLRWVLSRHARFWNDGEDMLETIERLAEEFGSEKLKALVAFNGALSRAIDVVKQLELSGEE